MEEQKKNFCDAIMETLNDFLVKLDGMREYVFSAIDEQTKNIISYLNKLNKEKGILGKTLKYLEQGDVFIAQIQLDCDNYENLNKKINGTLHSSKLIINGEIVSLVSVFDYYLYGLLKKTCQYLGDNFNNKDTSIKYSEIKNCTTTEEIKNYYIEKYLEELFKNSSHHFLFEEIKNRFNITEIRNYSHYKDLLFITELRNIIVHNDSKISIMFKNKMDELNIDYNQYKMINKEGVVDINPQQIISIFEILVFSSIYIALLFAIHFRKKEKKEIEEFLGEINSLTLDCIKKGYAKISIELFDCLLKISKSSSDKFIYTVNKCVALKYLNKNEEMKKTLDDLDWSNCEERFKFAKNCLLNNYSEAVEFLRKQEKKEEWKYNLQTWPLCKELVRSDIFIEEYPKIFGETFENKIKEWKNTKKDIKKVENSIKKAIKKVNKEKNNESSDKKEN